MPAKGFKWVIIVYLLLTVTNILAIPSTVSSDNSFSVIFDLPDVLFASQSSDTVYASDYYRVIINNQAEGMLFKLSYHTVPNSSFIKVLFDSNNFEMPQNSRKVVHPRFIVYKGIPSGHYVLYISVSGLLDGQGNVISPGYSKKIDIFVEGGNIYMLRVKTMLPDGTPIPAEFSVYWEVNDSLRLLYHDRGPEKFYYVREGNYVVRGFLKGVLKDEEKITVRRNETVILYFSTIIIEDFTIERKPIYSTDPLVFSFKLVSLEPSISNKKVEVSSIVKSGGKNYTQNLGSYTINGEQSITIRGILEPPDIWKSDKYEIYIYVTANGITLGFFKSTLDIKVEYPSISQGETDYVLIIGSALLGSIIGATSIAFLGRKKKGVKKKRKFEVYRILILGRDRPLAVYSMNLKRFQMELIENDEYLLLTSMIASLIQISRLTSSDSWNIGSIMFSNRKYIYAPIDNNFTLVLETEKDAAEFDPMIQNLLKGLSAYIYDVHKRNGITKVEDIINLSKYIEKFSDFSAILNRLQAS